MTRKEMPSSGGVGPQYVGFLTSSSCWLGVHLRNLNGPVPLGAVFTVPAAMSFALRIAVLSSAMAVTTATLGELKWRMTVFASGVSTLLIRAMLERATAAVLGSRILVSVAATSAELNGVPSWNLTPVRRFRVTVWLLFE